MDWAQDNAELSDKDLDNVFKYEEKSTTVVRILSHDQKPIVWSLENKNEWEEWLSKELPRANGSASGLVLILAKRTGEPSFASVKKVPSDDWLERISKSIPGRAKPHRTMTFATMGEKLPTASPSPETKNVGRRSVRTLPFSKATFSRIAKDFHVHKSIARVISRADVPVFFSAEVKMEGDNGETYPAYVYNCRSSNAWDMDLALTATYFPHNGLTFAILFGCSLTVEKESLGRLSFAMSEAAHPLLMSGIFAELERTRQLPIVESTIDELETRIFQLDFQSSSMEIPEAEAEIQNKQKRSAWLDTTYLRNSLVSWSTQLAKICQHVDELNNGTFRSTNMKMASTDEDIALDEISAQRPTGNLGLGHASHFERYKKAILDDNLEYRNFGLDDEETMVYEQDISESSRSRRIRGSNNLEEKSEKLRRTGHKIKDRIQGIIDEYDDKIRDCTMRVDGMAMATQWSLGEINVQIALATSRDSRHMRSIAIVTMVFLPGTFFATVFSMGFFNWFGSDGGVVSHYFWIYVLFTAFSTLLTLGSWWYFVSYRNSRSHRVSSEEESSLV